MTSFADHRTIVVSIFLPTSIAASFHANPVANSSSAPSDDKNESGVSNKVSNKDRRASTELTLGGPLTANQKSPTTSKFSVQRPTHRRQATSISIVKPPPESIVDDLLAIQKPNLNPPSGRADDDDDDDGKPLRKKANSFASFAASSLGLGTQDKAETARGRDRGDVDIDSQAQFEGSPKVRRLSRKRSKVLRSWLHSLCMELTLWVAFYRVLGST
jgi:hypothetical protein